MKDVFEKVNTPIIIHNNKFRSIIIQAIFPFDITDSEIGLIDLIPALLVHTSKKYPNETLFLKEYMKRYIGSFSCGIQQTMKNGFYDFTMIIPDPLYIKEDHLEEAIEFMIDTIYHPNEIDGAFQEDEFQKEKTALLLSIDNRMKSIHGYSNQKFFEMFDESGYYKNNIYNHKKDIEKMTSSDLFQVYQTHIQSKYPFIFVFGNVDDKKILHLLDKYLYHGEYEKISFSKKYNCFEEKKKLKEKEEEKEFHQSVLQMGYKVSHMKEEDIVILSVITSLLNSQSSNLLGKKLREEYQIVYTADARNVSRLGGLIITALVHRDNKEKAKEGIEQVINELQKKSVIAPLLQNIKERRYLDLIRMKEYKMALLDDYVYKFFEKGLTDIEEYEIIEKLTPSDIAEFAKRLQLDTIYFVKGVKNGN